MLMVKIKRIIDTILLFCFCFLTGTGLMMKFSFVKGLGPQTVLNLTKRDWETLHLYVGILMLAAVLVHLFSSKTWIVKVGAQDRKWLAFLIVGLGFAMMLALALAPASIAK